MITCTAALTQGNLTTIPVVHPQFHTTRAIRDPQYMPCGVPAYGDSAPARHLYLGEGEHAQLQESQRDEVVFREQLVRLRRREAEQQLVEQVRLREQPFLQRLQPAALPRVLGAPPLLPASALPMAAAGAQVPLLPQLRVQLELVRDERAQPP